MRIPIWLALAVLAALGYAARSWYRGLGVADIPLCVVNTSSDAPLEIRLDGKSLGLAPRMAGEDPKAALLAVLDRGEHEVEARDASGAVVAHEKLAVREGSHGFLWTPLPDPAFCFLLQTSEYGYSSGRAATARLEDAGPLRPLPGLVTQWFRDNPAGVSVRNGAKWDFERALRRANCPP